MVRTLTPRAQKGLRTVLLPGAMEAEPWELWSIGPSEAHCLRVGVTLRETSPPRDTIHALPAAQVFSLPLWLMETDPKLFRGIISLQLESLGLHPRGGEAVFDWTIITQEEKRTLVLVGVLPAILPEELEAGATTGFELAARCLPLVPNAVTFWMEQDRLVLAVTRGERLAYFQALAASALTPRTLQDVTCILAGLRLQDVIDEPQEAVFWTETLPAGAANFCAELGLPLRQEKCPAPEVPAEPWNLTPAHVTLVQRHRSVRQTWIRAAAILLLFILGAALALGLRAYSVSRDVGQLHQWADAHAQDLQMVQDARAEWKDLQPVVDPTSYPLEILLHVSESLPKNAVHLTNFEAGGGRVSIKAEATNPSAAFQFLDLLKKNPHFQSYAWQMAQPHALANDITQVQIEGTHATHD